MGRGFDNGTPEVDGAGAGECSLTSSRVAKVVAAMIFFMMSSWLRCFPE
jgi:hypothetical protein